jgi:Mn-dependent DtxR family transcriptional regulator
MVDSADPPRRLSPEMASFRLLVLACVREYIEANHDSPSYGEIAAALGSNRTRVRKAVKQLAAEGL